MKIETTTMQWEDYTTLKEMSLALNKNRTTIRDAKEIKAANYYWGKGPGGKEKRFLLSDLSSKYSVAVSRHRGKKQVRNTIPPEIMDTQRPWLVRMLGKILRPIILEALFGAES